MSSVKGPGAHHSSRDKTVARSVLLTIIGPGNEAIVLSQLEGDIKFLATTQAGYSHLDPTAGNICGRVGHITELDFPYHVAASC